jgi:short-chain fatty acids transporter
MIQGLGLAFSRLSDRFMPHPFVFALLLTLLTFLLGYAWGGTPPGELLRDWYEGIWNPPLLVFALQMALILVTGFALATTRPVRGAVTRLAGLVRGTASAVVITSLTAMTAGYLNWGLGLIVGALLAREIGQEARARGVRVHYPLVAAAGYTGLLVWHGGFSGSAPLSAATSGHPLAAIMGVVPISATILSPLNLATTVFLFTVVPLALARMAPAPADISEAPPLPRDRPAGENRLPTPATRLEDSRLLAGLVALAGLSFVIPYFVHTGTGGVNLNVIIFVFLLLGLLLHGTPRRYADSIDEGARGAGGILLQFPFYFGILGIMNGAGLVVRFAELFVQGARALSGAGVPVGSAHAVLTFLGAGVINLFVPSGGGQWAVQGPIAVEAARELGTRLPTAILAVSYGDELTNMLQPFWALPLLALTGLEARRIVGYTALLMLLVLPGFLLLLAIFGA